MSTTASYGRSRSGDRFYNPPAVRRQLQLQQQQQQQQQQLLAQKHKQQQQEREKEESRREKQQHYHQHHQNQHHNQNQNQQQNRRQKPAGRIRSCTPAADSSENRPESDDCVSTATTTPAASVSSQSTSAASNLTNLDRFLEHTTPLVPAQYFSKVRWLE